jgi:hypothetical protein
MGKTRREKMFRCNFRSKVCVSLTEAEKKAMFPADKCIVHVVNNPSRWLRGVSSARTNIPEEFLFEDYVLDTGDTLVRCFSKIVVE